MSYNLLFHTLKLIIYSNIFNIKYITDFNILRLIYFVLYHVHYVMHSILYNIMMKFFT